MSFSRIMSLSFHLQWIVLVSSFTRCFSCIFLECTFWIISEEGEWTLFYMSLLSRLYGKNLRIQECFHKKKIWMTVIKFCPPLRDWDLYFSGGWNTIELSMLENYWRPKCWLYLKDKILSSHNYLRISTICKTAQSRSRTVVIKTFSNVSEGPEENGKASRSYGKRRGVFHLFCGGNED